MNMLLMLHPLVARVAIRNWQRLHSTAFLMQFILKLGWRSPECSSGGSPDMAAIASSSNLVIGDSPEIFDYPFSLFILLHRPPLNAPDRMGPVYGRA